jgi:hypothetical protein
VGQPQTQGLLIGRGSRRDALGQQRPGAPPRAGRPGWLEGEEAAMEQSPEVRAVLSSLIETFGTPRMGSAFTDAVAAEPGVLVVGTDAAEWWDNPGDVLRALQAQSGELQGAAATVSHCQGWAQGDIGWGAVKADIVFAGGWKIVQFHGSVGAANEEVVGKELTV